MVISSPSQNIPPFGEWGPPSSTCCLSSVILQVHRAAVKLLDSDSRVGDGAKILEAVIQPSTLRTFWGIKRLVANSIKRTRVASPKVMTRTNCRTHPP